MSHLPVSSSRGLQQAVHRSGARSAAGILERTFTFVFKGLVYPQIWEDPEVDIEALQLRTGSRMVTIASGGCNVLSYLAADPAFVLAVDLNHAHVALTKLKLAAVRQLPSHGAFCRFFGQADRPDNLALYHRFIRNRLDTATRAFWESRDWRGRVRITLFSRGFYRHGMLGRFIGAAHLVARLYGVDPGRMLAAKTLDEQRAFFETALAPLFDKRLLRWATSQKISLYGLGIPPAQYDALAAPAGGDIAPVLRQRLERLACGFPLSDNYFAWQAFDRRYPAAAAGPLPPYLRREHFDAIRARTDRVLVVNGSVTEQLAAQDATSLDAYVLLDAQDWMTDAQLNALWAQITRTARPGARVVFRTAAEPSILPGRVAGAILDRWTYEAEQSRSLWARDRSSVYGGLHLYVFGG